ncbi:TPA: POTRA domain-containing protein [Salmonella enterica]
MGLYGSTAMAAFLPPPTGSGQLNNQLRQQDRTVPPAPVAPSISLPAGEHGSARAPESTARVTLKAVTFTGMAPVPGTHRVTEASLQKVVAPWLNRPLSFGDLQAMTDAVTRHYRDHGALVARAVLPPQTIKDGVGGSACRYRGHPRQPGAHGAAAQRSAGRGGAGGAEGRQSAGDVGTRCDTDAG